MSVYALPKNKSLTISQKIENVDSEYYASMFRKIDALNKKDEFEGDEEKYRQTRYIIANYIFIIYERLEKKVVRDISYKQVKRWAGENRELARYLLGRHFKDFELSAFDNWIQPEVEIIQMGMYSPSTRKNKNIYH